MPVLAVGQSVIDRQNRKRQTLELEIVEKLDRVLATVDRRVESIDQVVQTIEHQDGATDA
ncbi:MAG: hypothetical protein M1272_05770 [Firmicutes bacterium]|nr:hypothetical protein [Bacillota bacterium]